MYYNESQKWGRFMYRVILVDDEFLVREAVKETMDWGSKGFELKGCFQHGEDAMDYIRDNPVEVVLTDICMPYMDGLELSRLISKEYPNICVVILSGYDNFDYARRALKYRVREYILKPFSLEELGQALDGIREKLDQESLERRRLLKNREVLKSKLLMRLICGNSSAAELETELKSYGIALRGSKYMVAVGDAEIRGEDKESAELLCFAVYNIAAEIMGRSGIGYVIQKLDHQLVFLLLGNFHERWGEKAEKLFQEISDSVKNCMGIRLTIGIGSPVNRTAQLYLSYEEAEDMLEYRYSQEAGAILYRERAEKAAVFEEWEKLQEDLLNSVREGEKKKAEEALFSLCLRIQESFLKKDRAKSIIINTLSEARSMLEVMGMEDFEAYEQVNKYISQIDGKKSLEEERTALEAIFGGLVDAVAEVRDRKGNERAVLAVDYIRSHYGESSLNLQSICSYMAMSPSRFSAMFRECIGKSFVEVLSDTRMEKARELLETTSLKTYQIAEKTGFGDPHYFSLAFKKATGKTPTEYAKEKRR